MPASPFLEMLSTLAGQYDVNHRVLRAPCALHHSIQRVDDSALGLEYGTPLPLRELLLLALQRPAGWGVWGVRRMSVDCLSIPRVLRASIVDAGLQKSDWRSKAPL